ncbi:unnamed protein product [Prunus armeniaca]
MRYRSAEFVNGDFWVPNFFRKALVVWQGFLGGKFLGPFESGDLSSGAVGKVGLAKDCDLREPPFNFPRHLHWSEPDPCRSVRVDLEYLEAVKLSARCFQLGKGESKEFGFHDGLELGPWYRLSELLEGSRRDGVALGSARRALDPVSASNQFGGKVPVAERFSFSKVGFGSGGWAP